MDDRTRKKIMNNALLLFESGMSQVQIDNLLVALFKNQGDKSVLFVSGKAIEMLKSFDKAVDKAGGAGWPVEELLNMTVLDLFGSLATNGIRFIYDKWENQ